jgi:hypothetical protein
MKASAIRKSMLRGREPVQGRCDGPARHEEISEQLLVDVALVLCPVPQIVTAGEDSPDLRTEPQRVWKHLEDDVTVRWPISSVSQSSQAQRMSGVVDQIEAAFRRVALVLGVGHSFQSRLLEVGELLRVRRLLAQGLPGSTEILKRRGHVHHR